MGLENNYIEFFNYHIEKCGLNKTNMLEFGDQIGPMGTGKDYYSMLGFKHTSVDLNGNNGSLIKDLRDVNDFKEWHNAFEIITNAGTTEHVEPVEYQYECFSIIHDCLKVGGIQLHVLPSIEGLPYWDDHCSIYYSIEFFQTLAKENDYTILDLKMSSNHLLLACLQKTKLNSFQPPTPTFFSHLHLIPENISENQYSNPKLAPSLSKLNLVL